MFQIIDYGKEEMKRSSISEQLMIGIMWTSLMSSVEWNKKEELVTEQAIKHLKVTSDYPGLMPLAGSDAYLLFFNSNNKQSLDFRICSS